MGELAIVFVLLEVYGYVRKMAHTRYEAALAHGRDILGLEDHIGLDVELGVNQWLTRHHDLSQVSVWIYQHMHTNLTMIVLLLCYLAGPHVYRPARNALVLMNLVAMLVFFAWPVMPPRLLPDEGFVDTVAGAGFGTTHSPPLPADQYAAMPSLHVAWAVWVALVIMTLLRRYRVRWAATLHPISTCVVVVLTANHYVLDVVAGAAVAMAALWATGLIWMGDGTPYAGGQLIGRKGPDPVPDAGAVGAAGTHAPDDDPVKLAPTGSPGESSS